MQIELDQQLLGIESKPVVADGKPMTLRSAMVNATMTESPKEISSGEDKFKRFCLADRIQRAVGALDLDAADVKMIRERVGILYFPAVVGPVWLMLDAAAAAGVAGIKAKKKIKPKSAALE